MDMQFLISMRQDIRDIGGTILYLDVQLCIVCIEMEISIVSKRAEDRLHAKYYELT